MAQLVCHTKRANGKQTTSLLPVITLTIQPSGSGDLAAISSPIPNVSTAATQFLFFFYNQSCTLYQWLHCYYEVFAETEGLWKSNVSQMKQFWSADFTARLVGRGTPAHMYHMDYEIFAMSTHCYQPDADQCFICSGFCHMLELNQHDTGHRRQIQ